MNTFCEQLLELILASGNKDLVMANLAYYFSMAFRDMYAQASDPGSNLRRMRYGNEILHVLAKQALMYKGVADIGYPEAALVQIICELAESGNLNDHLELAYRRTIAHL